MRTRHHYLWSRLSEKSFKMAATSHWKILFSPGIELKWWCKHKFVLIRGHFLEKNIYQLQISRLLIVQNDLRNNMIPTDHQCNCAFNSLLILKIARSCCISNDLISKFMIVYPHWHVTNKKRTANFNNKYFKDSCKCSPHDRKRVSTSAWFQKDWHLGAGVWVGAGAGGGGCLS